ncbi:MAG: zf-TFIIB domain-containing protein [Planctomycetes bacterium]|nr:zf-TFIIB domain-containing protein [Planctomycetota bacterium]
MSVPEAAGVRCPRCDLPMARQDFTTFYADLCETGCHGLWFDAGELQRVDRHGKGHGQALERALAIPPIASEIAARPRTCRACDEPMDEIGYELHQFVKIDECPGCEGVFVDAGELAILRQRPLTATEAAIARRIRRSRRARRARREEETRRERQLLISLMLLR